MQTISSRSLIHRTVLSNGIILLVSENQAADIIAGRIFIRAGSCHEQPEKAGITHLLSTVMTKGCDGLSSLEIDEKVEQNDTRNFVFPRPVGTNIRLNTESNKMDVSHSYS